MKSGVDAMPLFLLDHLLSKEKNTIEMPTKVTLHYHLEVQANPKKMVPKNRCYF